MAFRNVQAVLAAASVMYSFELDIASPIEALKMKLSCAHYEDLEVMINGRLTKKDIWAGKGPEFRNQLASLKPSLRPFLGSLPLPSPFTLMAMAKRGLALRVRNRQLTVSGAIEPLNSLVDFEWQNIPLNSFIADLIKESLDEIQDKAECGSPQSPRYWELVKEHQLYAYLSKEQEEPLGFVDASNLWKLIAKAKGY